MLSVIFTSYKLPVSQNYRIPKLGNGFQCPIVIRMLSKGLEDSGSNPHTSTRAYWVTLGQSLSLSLISLARLSVIRIKTIGYDLVHCLASWRKEAGKYNQPNNKSNLVPPWMGRYGKWKRKEPFPPLTKYYQSRM